MFRNTEVPVNYCLGGGQDVKLYFLWDRREFGLEEASYPKESSYLTEQSPKGGQK
ncbi:MAG: hypothetical protein JSW55_15245 [Chloroflexota bacterium]|nr:MAG: hypothetical protein JSW55_15245 [Chloroflexota bacterium]